MDPIFRFLERLAAAATALGSEAASRPVLIQFLFDWQTIITGLVAGGGALLLWVQIRDQRSQVSEENRRRKVVARMRLPHALSEICDYMADCYQAWKKEDLSARPNPPKEAIEALFQLASDLDAATFLTVQDLLVKLQSFEARLKPIRDAAVSNRLEVMLADMARIRHLTDVLFPYGRLEVETVANEPESRMTSFEQINRNLASLQEMNDPATRNRVDRALDMRFGKK